MAAKGPVPESNTPHEEGAAGSAESIQPPHPTIDTAELLQKLQAIREASQAVQAALQALNDSATPPPSVWLPEPSAPDRSKVISLLLLQLLVLLCGFAGIVAFFFLPWLDLQNSSLPIVTPSGFSLAQFWNLGWLLWVEPIGAVQLIVLACLGMRRLMKQGAPRSWGRRLIVTTSLFLFALLLVCVAFTAPLAGVFYNGTLYALFSFDNGFWLGLLSLVLGLLASIPG